jgi:hypothetical protein
MSYSRLRLKQFTLGLLCTGLLCTGSLLIARDYGPAIGARMAAFELQDQDGKARSLQSLLGPKGAVILFYRSADW